MARLEKGVALVIRKAGVPVVPVAIDGSFEAWPKEKTLFHAHPIRMKYGKPMDFSGKKGEQIVRELEDELRRLLGELRGSLKFEIRNLNQKSFTAKARRTRRRHGIFFFATFAPSR